MLPQSGAGQTHTMWLVNWKAQMNHETDRCSYAPAPHNPTPVLPVPSNRQPAALLSRDELPTGQTTAPTTRPHLRDWTTLGIGGRAHRLVLATSEDEIVEAVREADATQTPILMLGGGSNLLVSDNDFAGVVIRDLRQNWSVEHDTGCGGVTVRATAGMAWDDFVALAVQHEWSGFESLSGIPGTVGASPVQNIGAYGHEVAQTLASVRVYDRMLKRRRTLTVSELELGYRTSILKRSTQDPLVGEGRTWQPTGRWVVLEVEFHTRRANLSLPIRYAELATRLGVEVGQRVDSHELREAVLEIRRRKHMVLDDTERDTYSAGSFFTNPIISPSQAQTLPPEAPRFPIMSTEDGRVKTSAAWLINHAGFIPGWKVHPLAPASLSTAHVLALTNRGGATSDDIVELARAVRDGVQQTWGITLIPEPVCVGLRV